MTGPDLAPWLIRSRFFMALWLTSERACRAFCPGMAADRSVLDG
jgi:hypothetical protein